MARCVCGGGEGVVERSVKRNRGASGRMEATRLQGRVTKDLGVLDPGPGSTCPKSSPTPTPVRRKDAGLLPSGPLPVTKHPPACVWGAKARHGANRVSIRIPDPWVGKITWRRERLPTPVFWPREFHGLYIVYGVADVSRSFLFPSFIFS